MPRPADQSSRFPRRLLVAATLVALLGVTAACSDADGRTLAEPDPNLTLTTPPTTAPPTTLALFLTLKSPAFEPGGRIPRRFTCAGPDVSPPLTIGNVPEGTDSLAIALTDVDAGGFVHWVVTDIDPAVGSVAADEVPAGAVEYPNDFGETGYGGPCPPDGELHNYEFTVYALPATAVDFVGPDETNGAGIIDAVSRLADASAALSAQSGDAG